MSATCPGRCCAVFYTPLKPIEWMQRATESKNPEAGYIFDMLIPLTYDEAAARWQRLFGGEMPDTVATPDVPGGHLYTCRHWDEETRLCGAYETRPAMCSGYPYGHTCFHGCEYKLSPEQLEAYKALLWDWSRWKWDAAAGGYRAKAAVTAAPEPGRNWSWDGEVLRPVDTPDWRWDSTQQAWVRTT